MYIFRPLPLIYTLFGSGFAGLGYGGGWTGGVSMVDGTV